ncbi:MAG: Ada metal-binding domain-containing protein [Lentilitoribacter sp.]
MKELTDIDWNAICESDAKFDGVFIYAVKTTGIFCKPSCKSRTPLRKNVIVFDDHQEAEFAGFRACLRCNPV